MAGNSSSSGSNFENATHQALYDMVAGGNHLEISYTGACLVQAGKEIEQIATELKAHVESVQWQGEGADAFREWSHDTAKQSHKLARFASTTGNALSDAGTALWEAKTMPEPKRTNSVQLDSAASPTARGATGAPVLTDPDREAAVAAMNRLASYYRTAQESIEGQELPNFQPASGFVPDAPRLEKGIIERYTAINQSGGGRAGDGAGGVGSASSTRSSGSEQGLGGFSHSTVGGAQHDPQVGTSVDSTAPVTAPGTTPPQRGAISAASEHSGLPSSPVPSGLPAIPGVTKALSGRGGTTGAPQSDTTGTGVTQNRPRSGMENGVPGATTQHGGTISGRPRLPGGTVMGEERGVMAPRSMGTGGNPPAAGSGANGGGAGSSGQRLVPPRGENAGAPRGAVMGEDRSAMARGVMGGGHPGGAGSGVSRGVPGRRWAYEPGGAVGAAPGGPVAGDAQRLGMRESAVSAGSAGGIAEGATSGTPSATGRGSASDPGRARGRAQAPRGQSGEFTSGGSGLTRGSASDGVHSVTGGRPLSSRGRRGSAGRPGYLQEDDETWEVQDRSVVPPVIE